MHRSLGETEYCFATKNANQQRNVFFHPADIQLHLMNNKPRCSVYSRIVGILSIQIFLSCTFSQCIYMYIYVYVLLWYYYILVQMFAFSHGQSLLTTLGLFLLGSCMHVIWVAVDFCVEKIKFNLKSKTTWSYTILQCIFFYRKSLLHDLSYVITLEWLYSINEFRTVRQGNQ